MTAIIDQEDLKKKLEAILFAAGRKVELEEIARLLRIKDLELIKVMLEALKRDYDDKSSPLLLTPEGNGWKLTVREKYLSLVREISPHTELAKALLETLAVIAWKQPILQSDVIKIRSSAAYEHIASLLELGFINREKKGRSYALKVTGKFFDYFDLPQDQQAINQVFKDVASAAEALQQLGQKEDQKKLDGLDVFEAGTGQAQKPEHPVEEALGNLEVYDAPGQAKTEETQTEQTEEGQQGEDGPGEQQSTELEADEEKEKDIEESEPSQDGEEGAEKADEDDDTTEAGEEDGEEEDSDDAGKDTSDDTEEEKPEEEKRTLPDALKKFAEDDDKESG